MPPTTTAETEDHCGDVHPRLKEVQNADIWLPVSRYTQYQDKRNRSNENEPLGGTKFLIAAFHEPQYVSGYQKVPSMLDPYQPRKTTQGETTPSIKKPAEMVAREFQLEQSLTQTLDSYAAKFIGSTPDYVVTSALRFGF